MIFRDKYGWSIETFEGFHPVKNFLKIIFNLNIRNTWRRRKQNDTFNKEDQSNTTCVL